MNKSKRICELLWICWHESFYDWDHCEKPHNGKWDENYFEGKDNDSGRVRLLRLMMERDDWKKFSRIIGIRKDMPYRIDFRYITEDGPLVDAVIEWMENHKK